MTIGRGGTFGYRAIVQSHKLRKDTWVGQARTLRKSSVHPGTVGEQPHLELTENHIRLRSTESTASRVNNPHFQRWGLRPSVSFDVGLAPAMLLKAGDELTFHRLGTGDMALTIIRSESLVLAVGAVGGLTVGNEVKIEEDPRIRQLDDLSFAVMVDKMKNPENQVFWIDTADIDLEQQIDLITKAKHSYPVMVVFKANSKLLVKSEILERISFGPDRIVWTYAFDFENKNAWLDYVKQIPRTRPNDLHISFELSEDQIQLREGEEGFLNDYYIRVERIERSVLPPGEYSMMLVAKLNELVTKEIAVESLRKLMRMSNQGLVP